jgi:GTP-binding protein HflX
VGVCKATHAALHLGLWLVIVRPMQPLDPAAPRTQAVIVGVQLPEVSDEAFESSLKELARLAETLGYVASARITQKRPQLATSAVVGGGKLKQLAALTGGTGIVPSYRAPGRQDDDDETEVDSDVDADDTTGVRASVVLVDHDLSPGQMRNLERATSAEVLDRSMVILSIFQRHARTREAKLQVEIASLAYSAPRLREASGGQDRARGGVGNKGAGESSLELDRRKIRDRISELRRELEIVEREAETRRTRRAGSETQTVALLGYTNAGKSSLMRALTGDAVLVADRLFATLDTTVRALQPETRPRILVSDTVGFIKKLPHDLVASFRSTLAEARDADLLLHVVDASDQAFREQLKVTLDVLRDLGAIDQPRLLLLNKWDRVSEEQRVALREEFPEARALSAKDPADVASLHAAIVELFDKQMQEEEFVIPYSAQRNVALLHERSLVLEERYEQEGTHVRVRATEAVLGGLRRELAK